MNILDIIVIAIFLISVLICTLKGFLKIIAGFGAVCVAFIASRHIGAWLGNLLLGDIIGGFSSAIGIVIMFLILLIVCRIIFGAVAKLITDILHTKVIDRILGALVGAAGGIAFAYLFWFVLSLVLSAMDLVSIESQLPALVSDSFVFKHFLTNNYIF